MLNRYTVVITLVSSLTPDDENVCATALLQHFVTVLKQLPIAYAIRIETADQVFQHSTPSATTAASPPPQTIANPMTDFTTTSAPSPLPH